MKPIKIIILATLTMVNYQLSMVNCSAQNVGVNTTGAAPDSKHLLEVLQPSTTDNSIGIYVKHSGADATKTLYGLQAIRDGAGLVNIAAYLQAINGTSNYALIVPSGGGNVGIGTSSPSEILNVVGSNILFDASSGLGKSNIVGSGLNLAALSIYSDGTTYSPGLHFRDAPGGLDWFTFMDLSDNSYKINYESGNIMTVLTNGNVGIGTTLPSTSLHIQSSVANSHGMLIESTSTTNAGIAIIELRGKRSDANQSPAFIGGLYLSALRSDQMMDADPTSASTYNNLGIIAFGANHTDGSASNILYPASISALSEADFTNSTTMPTALLFRTSSAGKAKGVVNDAIGTERMRITSGGNVAIGTSVANGALHIFRTNALGESINDETTDLFRIVDNFQSGGNQNIFHIKGIRRDVAGPYAQEWNYGGIRLMSQIDGAATATSWIDLFHNNSSTSNTIAFGEATTEWMRIKDGNVGIGTISPTHNIHVIGTAGLSTGTAWTNTSDIRLKDIRGTYEKGLKEIVNLNTVRFNYKKDNPLGLPSDKEIIGFIAQEVQKEIPEAVITREDGYLELNVDPIHWASVNAIKELNEKIEKQQQLIKQLESDNQELNRKNMLLENSQKDQSEINMELKSEIDEIKVILNQQSKK